jgi:hypothetical protein
MLPAGYRETDSGDISCATNIPQLGVVSNGCWDSTGEFKSHKFEMEISRDIYTVISKSIFLLS